MKSAVRSTRIYIPGWKRVARWGYHSISFRLITNYKETNEKQGIEDGGLETIASGNNHPTPKTNPTQLHLDESWTDDVLEGVGYDGQQVDILRSSLKQSFLFSRLESHD